MHTHTHTHTYIHTYINKYIHTYNNTYIRSMYPYVTMTIVNGTSHKYTNIHNFYSVNYYKYFTRQYHTS